MCNDKSREEANRKRDRKKSLVAIPKQKRKLAIATAKYMLTLFCIIGIPYWLQAL
jgi:hypothetical protein